MHELDSRRTVANPRRTRLSADWTAQPTTSPTGSSPETTHGDAARRDSANGTTPA
ncbi:hypothetical protein [Saccharothrix variisporea]|uniref:Uncharacterized protein n=1 Tax=Saccharothrix variisporea TaxID=543527 RepID=A0A495X219_9PSEU|nr:hypothetical protein [Saccharothrix variisporea]RKT67927.1 hypothetical protein DFJ66_1105 [Saccharothrix variisporea]